MLARALKRPVDRRVVLAAAALALAQALALTLPPGAAIALVALAMVWGSNTVSHIQLHTPIFSGRGANRAFSLALSMLLGVPQTLWRRRHLRHHARHAERVPPLDVQVLVHELVAIALALALLALVDRALPWGAGIALGYALCGLQGRMEHVAGVAEGWSSYGAWHNRLWFNDGHHAEHHRFPGVHWSQLPARRLDDAKTSAHAPLVRAFALVPALLSALERLALALAPLRRAVVAAHLRATRRVLAATPVHHALIVGGGLFPRSALVLSALYPDAALTVVDAERAHLDIARRHIARPVTWRHAFWTPHAEPEHDLVVIPLALRGQRRTPLAQARLVHGWIWERAERGARTSVVAWWLLKRVTLLPPG